jgi:hypothetical protein
MNYTLLQGFFVSVIGGAGITSSTYSYQVSHVEPSVFHLGRTQEELDEQEEARMNGEGPWTLELWQRVHMFCLMTGRSIFYVHSVRNG